MDTPADQPPPLPSRVVNTCPMHDLAGPEDAEILDANGGLAPPEEIDAITRTLAPHTIGAVLTAPHDIDVVRLNSALNVQIGHSFFIKQGYRIVELDDAAYEFFGSVRRRAVSVFGSASTRWGAWMVIKEDEMPFFVIATCHAGSTWCGPYAHEGYGWGKDRVGDIKMQQANLERGLAGKDPMPLDTSAFILFDFHPPRAQALVDERFGEGSPPWTHPSVRGGHMSALAKRKVQEKAVAARHAFRRARDQYGEGSPQCVEAENEATRWEDEADRVYGRGAYSLQARAAEAEEVAARPDATEQQRAAARKLRDSADRQLAGLKLGWTLQARATEAEEVAARPDATSQQKAAAEKLRASADRCLENLELGRTLQARATEAEEVAARPDATSQQKAAAEKLRDSADRQLAGLELGRTLQARATEAEEVAARPDATSQQKAAAEKLRDSADRQLAGFELGWTLQKRATEAEEVAARPDATSQQKAEAEKLRASADRCLENLKLGWTLQNRATEAEEVAARPDATSQQKAEAKRLRDSVDRQLAGFELGGTLQARAVEAEEVAARPDATSQQKAEAKKLRASADRCLENFELGRTLQKRATEAEEVAALPDATEQQKAEAKRLRDSADKQLGGFTSGSAKNVLKLWAAATAPNATQAEKDDFEHAKAMFRAKGGRAVNEKTGYRNVEEIQRKSGRSFRAKVKMQDETVRSKAIFVRAGEDDADAKQAAAKDADVIYIALFRKFYGDFDVDHPLASPLNFPSELDELQRRSRDKTDAALQNATMQAFLASSSSTPVHDPAAGGSGRSMSAAGEDAEAEAEAEAEA